MNKIIYVNHIRFEVNASLPYLVKKLCDLVNIPSDNADVCMLVHSKLIKGQVKEVQLSLDKSIKIKGGEEFIIMRKFVIGN
jgi:hypothetical protein